MKHFRIIWLSVSIAAAVCNCVQNIQTPAFQFDTSEQQILYDLMVERCAAINARDLKRLEKVYADQSTEYEWLKNRWLAVYERYRIMHRVYRVEKISIVDGDGAGRFVIKREGQLYGRNPYPTVDVLFVMQTDGWKILMMSERR
jgi:hypothetical protein